MRIILGHPRTGRAYSFQDDEISVTIVSIGEKFVIAVSDTGLDEPNVPIPISRFYDTAAEARAAWDFGFRTPDDQAVPGFSAALKVRQLISLGWAREL